MNKTIKVIDLLNKIANGEEVPTLMKYDSKFKNEKYGIYKGDCTFMLYDNVGEMKNDEELEYFLNDEIEIIEEDKDIEELPIKTFHKKQRCLANKINELIREINSIKKER